MQRFNPFVRRQQLFATQTAHQKPADGNRLWKEHRNIEDTAETATRAAVDTLENFPFAKPAQVAFDSSHEQMRPSGNLCRGLCPSQYRDGRTLKPF
jgi:hypothetical protein